MHETLGLIWRLFHKAVVYMLEAKQQVEAVSLGCMA